ncbi:MAG: EVE domain-containing protein [Gammaproteobacteria bacterium]|nr:EVE domain-containing protein [Gammaproteobacteria bacterium]MCW5583272.1 EVE domain-containing protein [Gammaproteobacteria bacterium]
MHYWLFKSEPTCFSIDDLSRRPQQVTCWDGVRNYQVRNMLRDEIKVGDWVFFYHSSCNPPGIAGIMEVIKNGYPDHTAWDLHSDHYDPKSTPENPRWYMVDVKLVSKFSQVITLDQIKNHPKLKKMLITRKGNRLSITPVTVEEWTTLLALSRI